LSDRIGQRVGVAVAAALDKKASGLEVLEVTELTSLADYFIICSGASERQAVAIADGIEEKLRVDSGTKPRLVEGLSPGRWVVMDYGDFIVHVFTEECRTFYGLERLWGDAPDVTERFAGATDGRSNATSA
jgi:ribosome-associated protein